MNDRLGFGTVVSIATVAAPTVFTDIGYMNDVTPPSTKVDDVESTTHASSGGWRTFRPGLKKLDKMTFKINWEPGDATDLLLQGYVGTTVVWRMTYPNGITDTFNGHINSFVRGTPIDNLMMSTVDVTPSGLITEGSIAAPTNTVKPSIAGPDTVHGTTLTADPGQWTGAPTFTYVWKRDGVAIGGATNSTYVLQVADETHAITLTVTGTNATGSASATSLPTAAVT